MPKHWSDSINDEKFAEKEKTPFLKMEPGEQAIVKISGIQESTFKGKEQTILTAETGKGEKVLISDRVLVRMFQDGDIEKSEVLKIICTAWKQTGNGRYRVFEVLSAGIHAENE